MKVRHLNDNELEAHDLFGNRLGARDGEMGRVHDLYFEDRRWIVRYLVIDTRPWVAGGRRVLVPPDSVLGIDARHRRLEVNLTRAEILGSPDIDTNRPVSRQHEVAFHEYYGIPFYWSHDALLDNDPTGDPHLWSLRSVSGYTVRVGDAPRGHVSDFVVDTRSWTIAKLVVTVHRWPRGERHVVRISALERLSWLSKSVYIERNRAVRPARTA